MNTSFSPQVYTTLICWLLFCSVWLWQRNNTKENVNTRTGSQKAGAFLGYVIMFFSLYLPLFFPESTTAQNVVPQHEIVQYFGVTLCVSGIFIAIWSRLLLGWNWSGGVAAKKDHELVMSGPYRFIRHPIYTGFIAALIGTSLVMGGLVGIVVAGLYTLGLCMKINKEEELLTGLFGDTYSDYKKRTRKLVPFVW